MSNEALHEAQERSRVEQEELEQIPITDHFRCPTDGELITITQNAANYENVQTCPTHKAAYLVDITDEAGSYYYCAAVGCSVYRVGFKTTDPCGHCGKAKVQLSTHPCYPAVEESDGGKSKKTRQRDAIKKQLAKEDNSGHGKHVASIPKGSKGDSHQKGQKRKVDRVKNLTSKLDRL
jgi:hypothetical protein